MYQSTAQARPARSELGNQVAESNGWGEAKCNALDAAFRSLTVVNINHPMVIDAYVKLDLHARSHPLGARRMGKNDLWIASTAIITKAKLLTIDADFDHLKGIFLQLERFKLG